MFDVFIDNNNSFSAGCNTVQNSQISLQRETQKDKVGMRNKDILTGLRVFIKLNLSSMQMDLTGIR